MAKRRKRKEPTKQAQEFSKSAVESFDYEKLAQCLTKAIAEENDKRKNAYSATREWMKFVAWPIFGSIILLMIVLGAGSFIMTFDTIKDIARAPDTGDGMAVFKAISSFFVSLICFGIAIMAFFAGKEFQWENDRQFVVSVFSSLVSLVALVVALVALFRG